MNSLQELMQNPEEGPVPKERFEMFIRLLALELENFDQVEMPTENVFAPGVYHRTIFMPAETFIIGRTHKTKHLNIVMQGEADVWDGKTVRRIKAPEVFVSEAGAQKVFYIHQNMVWSTVHPTEETDMLKLEEMMVFSRDEEIEMIKESARKLEGA